MTNDKMKNYLTIQNLVKYFGNDRAVDGISFDLTEGQFLTLLGPSGCGKTTTLMCIAGLHKPDAGEISVGGKSFTSMEGNIFLQPEKRDIGMVFQSYAIWPHMTVEKNISYPLEVRNCDPSEIEDILSVYDEIRYVIVTRDLSASMLSRISRFEGNIESYEKDNARASNFFKKLVCTLK